MFKDRLRAVRISKGFTLQQIADELHTGLRNYQKYESGHASPTLESLVKIADIFETSVDYLLCRDDYLNSIGVSIDVPKECPPRRSRRQKND